jgi:hypothetical protein
VRPARREVEQTSGHTEAPDDRVRDAATGAWRLGRSWPAATQGKRRTVVRRAFGPPPSVRSSPTWPVCNSNRIGVCYLRLVGNPPPGSLCSPYGAVVQLRPGFGSNGQSKLIPRLCCNSPLWTMSYFVLTGVECLLSSVSTADPSGSPRSGQGQATSNRPDARGRRAVTTASRAGRATARR